MPRLSLYRPEKTKDFKFIDRTIYEMFQVGGVDVFVHKYIGPVDPSDSSKALGETTIQDVLFLENRDRKYDQDVFTIRGHYQTSDVDFNLSQFGLFLSNDTVFMTIHINNTVDLVGRKIMSGDVFELPNLREEFFLEDTTNPLKALRKFYVVEDINRAAEGFSATWYPHLYRVKLKPMVNSQEFKDILERPEDTDTYAGDFDPLKVYYPGQVVKYLGVLYKVLDSVGANGTSVPPPNTNYWTENAGNSLKDILSTYNKEIALNNAVVLQAEQDAGQSGYETSHFYTLAVDPETGRASVNTVDTLEDNVADGDLEVSHISNPPVREGYQGYLLGDGIAPNGPLAGSDAQFGFGIQFPQGPMIGDTFLRTDYLPNRLFVWDGRRWVKQEDNVRMTMTNTDSRQTHKTSFINNQNFNGIDKVGSDVVVIDSVNGSRFESGLSTNVDILTTGVYIVTSLPYNSEYRVEAWLSETVKVGSIGYKPDQGKFAFTINDPVIDGVRIRYTVYATYVEERQAISKALRKLKPEADV